MIDINKLRIGQVLTVKCRVAETPKHWQAADRPEYVNNSGSVTIKIDGCAYSTFSGINPEFIISAEPVLIQVGDKVRRRIDILENFEYVVLHITDKHNDAFGPYYVVQYGTDKPGVLCAADVELV